MLAQDAVELIELTDADQKREWHHRFRRGYSGALREETGHVYDADSRFLVANSANTSLGYLRLTNKTRYFKDRVTYEVWNVSEAYVRKPYRGRGVHRQMMICASARHDVRMVYLERAKYKRLQPYYAELGFGHVHLARDPTMMWLFRNDFAADLKGAVAGQL